MADRFLDLPRDTREEILEDRAVVLGRTAVVVEKDVWVCWALEHLFSAPGRVAMAFKGGTSLSKVYGAIARFSEDVDITLDCRALVDSFDPFAEGVSGQRRKKHTEQLNAAMAEHVSAVLEPHLRSELTKQFGEEHVLERGGDDKLMLRYASALPPADGYVKRNIQIEFGGRNSLEPSDTHQVQPYLAATVDTLEFPFARVDVLRPERTFWEKATLIHVECCRAEFRPSRERYARHWYDVAQLSDHDIGRAALANRALLEDVVKYKKVFYNSGQANYDACLVGGLRLVPADEMQRYLRADFEKMLGEGMFEGAQPRFENVMERLTALEREINIAVRPAEG